MGLSKDQIALNFKECFSGFDYQMVSNMTSLLPIGQNEAELADLIINVMAIKGELMSLVRYGACHMAYGGGAGVFIRIWNTTFAEKFRDVDAHPSLGISKSFLRILARDYEKRLPNEAKTQVWQAIITQAPVGEEALFRQEMALIADKRDIDPTIAARCLLSNRMMSTITASLIKADMAMEKSEQVRVEQLSLLGTVRGIAPITFTSGGKDYQVPYVPHYFMVADEAAADTLTGQFKIALAYYSVVAGRADAAAASKTTAENQAADSLVSAF